MVCAFGFLLLLCGGMCLGFSLFYSGIANADLATANCEELCGSGYVTFDAKTCCISGNVHAC